MARKKQRVFVFGAGKVGAGLTAALRRAGVPVVLRPKRRGLPARPIDAELVVLALRDRELGPCAEELRARGLVGTAHKIAVVHCAGALGPDVLAPVRGPRVAVAQMHPMISFASKRFSPTLTRGQLHVDGDPHAVRLARELVAKPLGFSARTIPGLDRTLYHAAAGLVANGAAALAAGGLDLLARAGIDPATGAKMLGPLLRSVAENVERLGMPGALTGPVRRGDVDGVARHLEILRRAAPDLVPFYLAACRAQVPLARSLDEAPGENFDAIENLCASAYSPRFSG